MNAQKKTSWWKRLTGRRSEAEAQALALPPGTRKSPVFKAMLKPLLAAEKAGESDVIPVAVTEQGAGGERVRCWINTLQALGEMWKATLPDLLKSGGRMDGRN